VTSDYLHLRTPLPASCTWPQCCSPHRVSTKVENGAALGAQVSYRFHSVDVGNPKLSARGAGGRARLLAPLHAPPTCGSASATPVAGEVSTVTGPVFPARHRTGYHSQAVRQQPHAQSETGTAATPPEVSSARGRSALGVKLLSWPLAALQVNLRFPTGSNVGGKLGKAYAARRR
jgi:hypothetical protein